MAYKGFNTLVQEMKVRQLELIEEYTLQGIPAAVLRLNLESAMLHVDTELAQRIAEERKQYLEEQPEEVQEETHDNS